MYPWLLFWAPQLHFPWSGDVAQRIEPITHLFFQGIRHGSGNARIEERAFSVASYGKQLGLIAEILLDVADRSGTSSQQATAALHRLKDIVRRIEEIKRSEYDLSVSEIVARVEELQRSDDPAYSTLRERLLPVLGVEHEHDAKDCE